ncbi:MAG: indolepyruvate oxidoreductase subunit beta [Deltaproteobacteria bacterium]|nr:indolepyruvate oxidoreductase subunit beta [Deltaproteobacteria bacterium]
MRIQMIISGVGGQGVLFATRIFSVMAMTEGNDLIGSETHGMSQRGGSVITHLKIGDFESPLVERGRADVLLCLEKSEAYRALPYIRQRTRDRDGGICFVNAPAADFLDGRVSRYLEEKGVEILVFPAGELAREMGSPRSANIALIGFASAHPRLPFSPERLRSTIGEITPPGFREISLKIFDKALMEGRNTFRS